MQNLRFALVLSPVMAGVNGKGFGLLGGYVPVALAPGLAAKPA